MCGNQGLIPNMFCSRCCATVLGSPLLNVTSEAVAGDCRTRATVFDERSDGVADGLWRAGSGTEVGDRCGYELWRHVRRETFVKIFEAFERIGARVERVQWFGIGFRILAVEEPFEDWKKRLPSFINGRFVGYIFGGELIHEKPLMGRLPMGAEHDDEVYSELRPGVKISTGRNFDLGDGSEVMTTSGICVESPNGEKYITTASHGFPAGIGSEVMNPRSKGRLLGTIAKIYGGTDIALCELKPEVTYSRETFRSTDAETKIKPSQGFADPSNLSIGDPVFLDTPYSGRCEGNLMIVEMMLVPSDDPLADRTQYAVCLYIHFGIGANRIFDGCCGGLIWNEKHNVLGPFSYQSGDGNRLCYCPTFMQLRDAGYKIAES